MRKIIDRIASAWRALVEVTTAPPRPVLVRVTVPVVPVRRRRLG